jgi:hypothetical protein
MTLILEKIKNPYRKYLFLKEKKLLEFIEFENPYEACFNDFKLHTF